MNTTSGYFQFNKLGSTFLLRTTRQTQDNLQKDIINSNIKRNQIKVNETN